MKRVRCMPEGSLSDRPGGEGQHTVSIPKATVLPILSVARVIAVQLGIATTGTGGATTGRGGDRLDC